MACEPGDLEKNDVLNKDPEVIKHLRAFTEETIFDGLKWLETLNPNPTHTLLERVEDTTLYLNCSEPPSYLLPTP